MGVATGGGNSVKAAHSWFAFEGRARARASEVCTIIDIIFKKSITSKEGQGRKRERTLLKQLYLFNFHKGLALR